MDPGGHSRRALLAAGTATAAAAMLGSPKLPAGGKMPMRSLGRTGVEVSLLGLGGYHLGMHDEKTAVRLVHTAVDHGVTFMDNCWDYNDGNSHLWMGRALRDGYRQRVFLMTKIDGRTRKPAAEQIDQSLRALGVDVIDLMQIHEVIRKSDTDRSLGAGGALEALQAAKQAGKIRFIGFTGHKSPDLHLRMLAAATARGFRFDAVQMPLSVMDAHYESFEKVVLPVLLDKKIGVLGMKPLGSGVFLRSRPFTEGSVTPTEALHYAMNLSTSTVITGCDTTAILMQGIDAAYRWKPMGKTEIGRLLARTAPVAANGAFERYKTSQDFDGTARNPHWLETAKI
jgi:aryl-alcohol dehydrogenase-like predicted oxidoreductase